MLSFDKKTSQRDPCHEFLQQVRYETKLEHRKQHHEFTLEPLMSNSLMPILQTLYQSGVSATKEPRAFMTRSDQGSRFAEQIETWVATELHAVADSTVVCIGGGKR